MRRRRRAGALQTWLAPGSFVFTSPSICRDPAFAQNLPGRGRGGPLREASSGSRLPATPARRRRSCHGALSRLRPTGPLHVAAVMRGPCLGCRRSCRTSRALSWALGVISGRPAAAGCSRMRAGGLGRRGRLRNLSCKAELAALRHQFRGPMRYRAQPSSLQLRQRFSRPPPQPPRRLGHGRCLRSSPCRTDVAALTCLGSHAAVRWRLERRIRPPCSRRPRRAQTCWCPRSSCGPSGHLGGAG